MEDNRYKVSKRSEIRYIGTLHDCWTWLVTEVGDTLTIHEAALEGWSIDPA